MQSAKALEGGEMTIAERKRNRARQAYNRAVHVVWNLEDALIKARERQERAYAAYLTACRTVEQEQREKGEE